MILRSASTLAILAVTVTLTGCGGFKPLPVDETNLFQRTETRNKEDATITVAVPTIDEARALFDSKLHKKGIQPVWIEIDNRVDEPAWFFSYSVDPDYFPPLEVAWRSHRTWAKKTNRRIDEFFHEQSIPVFVPENEKVSGWIFVNLDLGHKYVPITLIREGELQEFEFIVKVPGLRTDYNSVDFEGLYPAEEFIELEDEEALRDWAEELPCCATNAKGTKSADPLNFVLVASDQAFLAGFKRSRWDETRELTTGAAMRTATSAVFGKAYRYAAMSSLYSRGRSQDIGLQKARKSVHQRNHLRLWLAPVTYRGMWVWIGQISRDIGSRMTTKSSTLTTHKIDPDVDDARDVLILDLATAGVLEAFGYATGVGRATADAPRGNLTGDPYFTDGLRVVLILTEHPTTFEELRFLDWEEPSYERN